MGKSGQSLIKAFLQASWSCSGCYKDKKNQSELNLLISFHDYCSQMENAIKTNAILVHFPQNEHWSDSMWRVCNISSVIILKYINRDLCIVEQRGLFLQERSSEFCHWFLHLPTTWPWKVTSSSWQSISSIKLVHYCPTELRITQVMSVKGKNCNTLIINYYDYHLKNMINRRHTKIRIIGLNTNML